MKNRQRILILDGHTTQALACVRSLGAAGHEVMVAGDQPCSIATWSRYCQTSFRLAGQNLPAYALLREWAQRHNVNIVLPLTERSATLCNSERAEWEELDMTIGCGPDDMLVNAFDKAQTILIAKECGVRIPLTYFPKSLKECLAAVDEIGLPCVVKARRSSAWNGRSFYPNRVPAYMNHSESLMEALMDRKQGDDWPLIQEVVGGKGKGVSALCDHGTVVAWFAHERLRDTRPTGSGSNLRRAIPLTPRLREPAERLLADLKWHGPAMVEFKDDEINPPCLMEINGRFWGSLQLAIDSGVNFPLLWLGLLNGRLIGRQTVYREGTTLRWLWGDCKRFGWILRGAPPGFVGAYPTIWQGLRELLGPQPRGTRCEAWRANDPWPAVGEFAEGMNEFWAWLESNRAKLKRRLIAGDRMPGSEVSKRLDTGEAA